MAVVGAVAPSWYSVLVAAAGKGNAALSSPVQVAQTYLCVLCPRSDPVSHHSLMKPATLSPETLQSLATSGTSPCEVSSASLTASRGVDLGFPDAGTQLMPWASSPNIRKLVTTHVFFDLQIPSRAPCVVLIYLCTS